MKYRTTLIFTHEVDESQEPRNIEAIRNQFHEDLENSAVDIFFLDSYIEQA